MLQSEGLAPTTTAEYCAPSPPRQASQLHARKEYESTSMMKTMKMMMRRRTPGAVALHAERREHRLLARGQQEVRQSCRKRTLHLQ
jgi:hypothetical protein